MLKKKDGTHSYISTFNCTPHRLLQCANCIAVCQLYCSVPTVLQCTNCIAVCQLYCSVPTVLQCANCIAVYQLYCSVPTVLQCTNCIAVYQLYCSVPTVFATLIKHTLFVMHQVRVKVMIQKTDFTRNWNRFSSFS
jgi:hypothetical protein